jgi:hypothetical protein
MMIQLTDRLYIDNDSIETVRFYEKGDAWCSPVLMKATKTFNNPTFDATFKRRTPIRLVGPEAQTAWANWQQFVRDAETKRQGGDQ